MNFWPWGKSNTKKEKSEQDYKEKYFRLKKKLRKVIEGNIELNKDTMQVFQEYNTQLEVLKYILFSIIVQAGGTLEITKETFDISNNMFKNEEAEFENKDGGIVYTIKRREKPNAS